jgi:uncharacterized membrane protein HdeD (DUF308 family)
LTVQDILGKNWWAVLIRGILAIVFGIIAIAWPAHALAAVILVFGAYAFVDGIFAIISAIRSAARHAHWFALLVEGILGVIIGIISFVHPGITALAFLYFIAAWAIITGLLELFAAFRLRRDLGGEFLFILGGLASIIFGILLVIFPGAGAFVVVTIIGIYAIIFGVVLVLLSLRLKKWHESRGGGAQQPATA